DWAPRSVRDKIKLLERTYAQVELRLGRPGSDEEVAGELGFGVDDLHKMLSDVAQASVLSLDEMLFSSEPDASLRVVDTVEDTSATGSTTRAVEKQERRHALGIAIKRLPEREHLV